MPPVHVLREVVQKGLRHESGRNHVLHQAQLQTDANINMTRFTNFGGTSYRAHYKKQGYLLYYERMLLRVSKIDGAKPIPDIYR